MNSSASHSITPLLFDFISDKCTLFDRYYQTLIWTAHVFGHNPVHWRFLDSFNKIQDIYRLVQYIPEAGICLFNPQYYFTQCGDGNMLLYKDDWNITLRNRNSFKKH